MRTAIFFGFLVHARIVSGVPLSELPDLVFNLCMTALVLSLLADLWEMSAPRRGGE